MPINMQHVITPISSADPIDDTGFEEGIPDQWISVFAARLRNVRSMGVMSKARVHCSVDIIEKMIGYIPLFQDEPLLILQSAEDNERMKIYVDFDLAENTVRIG